MLPDHPRTLLLAAALSLVPVCVLVGVAFHADAPLPALVAALASAIAVGLALCAAWRIEGRRRLAPGALGWMAALAASPVLAFLIHAGGALDLHAFYAVGALTCYLNTVQLDAAFRAAGTAA